MNDDAHDPDRPGRPRMGTVGKVGLSLAVAATVVLLVEGACSILLAWRDTTGETMITEERHCRHDPDLGWSHEPSIRVSDLYGAHRHLTTNARGFRGTEEHTPEVPADRYRIVCLGDSFTLGFGVDDTETYPAQLERLLPAIQTVNMGQGGYGLDQCYLWYERDGIELESDLLLLVFIAPDFDRMTEHRFNGDYPKPWLEVVDGGLEVRGVPTPDDWTSSAGSRRVRLFFERWALSDTFRRVQRRFPDGSDDRGEGPFPYRAAAELLLADLAGISRERGQDFALVMLPLRNRTAGRPAEVSAWLTEFAGRLGVPFLDLSVHFDRLPRSEVDLYYLPEGHFNALGNRLVAETLLRELQGFFPGFPR